MDGAVRFPNDLHSAVEARRAVVAALQGCPEEVVADASLLASELVSNAIVHAGTPFEVAVDRRGGWIRVTVADGSTEPPVAREPSPLDEGGRGLLLVSGVAERWGVDVRPQGKAVWFELHT